MRPFIEQLAAEHPHGPPLDRPAELVAQATPGLHLRQRGLVQEEEPLRGAVAPVKMAELPRFGVTAKAFRIRQLEDSRRAATLLATVRHLEGVSVDDALLLFDLLMSTRLLSQAGLRWSGGDPPRPARRSSRRSRRCPG